MFFRIALLVLRNLKEASSTWRAIVGNHHLPTCRGGRGAVCGPADAGAGFDLRVDFRQLAVHPNRSNQIASWNLNTLHAQIHHYVSRIT